MKPRASQATKRASTLRATLNRRKSVVRKGDADGDELNEFGRPIDPRFVTKAFKNLESSPFSFEDIESKCSQ